MQFKQIVILVILVLKDVYSQETEEMYIHTGRGKVISILNGDKETKQILHGVNFKKIDTTAQRYANEWSYLRANMDKKSNDVPATIDKEAITVIFGKRSSKSLDMEVFKEKFEDEKNSMKNEILRVAKAKAANGQMLVDIWIGYIHEDMQSIRKIIHNLVPVTKLLNVHLLTVLMFSRKTVFPKWFEVLKVQIKDRKPEANFNTTDLYFHGDFSFSVVWLQAVNYTYEKFHWITENLIKTEKGYFVIATTFPHRYGPDQQDALIRRIPALSLGKHCPLAAKVARASAARQSPIGDKTSRPDDKPKLDPTTAKFCMLFEFPVKEGMPPAETELNLEEIEKHISGLSPEVKIRGAAFGRLIERNVRDNIIKYVMVLALIIDDEILGFNLSKIKIYPEGAAGILDFATNYMENYKRDKETPCYQYENPGKLPTFALFSSRKDGLFRDPKILTNLRTELVKFFKSYPHGSVALAIVPGPMRYNMRVIDYPDLYCIIYSTSHKEDSDTYYDVMQLKVDDLIKDASTDSPGETAELRSTRDKNWKRFEAEVPKYFKWSQLCQVSEFVRWSLVLKRMKKAEEYLRQKIVGLEFYSSSIRGPAVEVTGVDSDPNIFYVTFESKQLPADHSVKDVLEHIQQTFATNAESRDEEKMRGMPILPGKRDNVTKLEAVAGVAGCGCVLARPEKYVDAYSNDEATILVN